MELRVDPLTGVQVQVTVSRQARPNRSASSEAAQPVPAAVMAWRYVWSTRSPAAKTPGRFVAVDPGCTST